MVSLAGGQRRGDLNFITCSGAGGGGRIDRRHTSDLVLRMTGMSGGFGGRKRDQGGQ